MNGRLIISFLISDTDMATKQRRSAGNQKAEKRGMCLANKDNESMNARDNGWNKIVSCCTKKIMLNM